MSPFVCGVENSLSGQPWRWRRAGGDELGRDLIDQLLLARGIEEADLARNRQPTIRDFLPDPSVFADMDKAAARLADAVEASETIAIFGDYDVDGATSAALLTILLRQLGNEPIVYIPDRLMEGYGPSGAALVELQRRGASLAITVDCGAQAFDALQEAADAGLDVIVCDHHQCATEPSGCPFDDQPQPARRKRDRRGARTCRRSGDGIPARRRTAARTARPRLFR